MNKAEIAAKVEARAAADEVHRLAGSEAIRFTGTAALAFWKQALANVCAVLPPEYHPTRIVERGQHAPMTDEESRAFELGTFPFGMHRHTRIKDVPMDYLLWMEEQPDFRRQLNRYLRSERIQREQP